MSNVIQVITRDDEHNVVTSGSQGPQGMKGDKGDTGNTGPAGAQGGYGGWSSVWAYDSSGSAAPASGTWSINAGVVIVHKNNADGVDCTNMLTAFRNATGGVLIFKKTDSTVFKSHLSGTVSNIGNYFTWTPSSQVTNGAFSNGEICVFSFGMKGPTGATGAAGTIPGIGDAVTGGSAGSILFLDADAKLAENNAAFQYVPGQATPSILIGDYAVPNFGAAVVLGIGLSDPETVSDGPGVWPPYTLYAQGQNGGSTTDLANLVGGTGSSIYLVTGNGGSVSGAADASGGAAGGITLTSGQGGAAEVTSGSHSCNGGQGADFYVSGGIGGTATGGSMGGGGFGGSGTLGGGDGGNAVGAGLVSGNGGDVFLVAGQAGTAGGGATSGVGGTIAFYTGNGNRARINADADIVLRGNPLGTGMTKGFLYLPSVNGAPTGTPSNPQDGCPVLLDTANSKMWIRFGSTWKYVQFV